MSREVEAAAIYSLIADYSQRHPAEVAEMLEGVPADEAYRILQSLPEQRAAAVFREISIEDASRILTQMEGALTHAVVRQVDAGYLATLMARLDQDARRRVSAQLSPAEAEQLRVILESEPDTAGALLDSSVLTVATDTTVDEALAKVRKVGSNASEFLYVVNADRGLEGAVSLSTLARSLGSRRMEEICSPRSAVVEPTVSRGEILSLLDQVGLAEIPVVGNQGRFLGVVLAKRLRERDEEEARHSMRETLDRKLEERPDTPWPRSIRLRAPWLALHLLAGAVASLIVGLSVGSLAGASAAQSSILIAIPFVLLATLRAGTQPLNVSVRGLTLGAISPDDWAQRFARELLVGFGLAVLATAVAAPAVYLWGPMRAAALPLAVSLLMSIPLSAAVGGVAPLLVLRFGKQPLKPAAAVVAAFSAVVGIGSIAIAARLLSAIN